MGSNLKGLDTRWTKHLQGQEKDDFELIVRNSTLLLTRLRQIFQERENEIINSQYSLNDFDSPSWALKTAYRNGQLADLKSLKDLIPFNTP